jgi:hypothetical protein
MNERIEELEAQCWEPKQYGPPWFNSQKFAELIVRECASIAQTYMSRWPEDHELTKQIKEHFGVEE